MGLNKFDWKDLIEAINSAKCVPFVGKEVNSHWIPSDTSIATKWVKEYENDHPNEYPFKETNRLSQVAQFLAIQDDNDLTPKQELKRELGNIDVPNFSSQENKTTAYSILADLNLPIYITTNYDHFMEEALKSKGKEPVSVFCKWKETLKKEVELEFGNKDDLNLKSFKPSSATPVVYHILGDIAKEESIVITDRDYIEFLIYLTREFDNVVPSYIKQAISQSVLLFLGYRLEDVNFLLLWQSVINFIRPMGERKSIAVQINSDLNYANQEKVASYLDKYTKNLFKIRVYWGEPSNFTNELSQRWDRFKSKGEF
jgi:SIR2-like domain